MRLRYLILVLLVSGHGCATPDGVGGERGVEAEEGNVGGVAGDVAAVAAAPVAGEASRFGSLMKKMIEGPVESVAAGIVGYYAGTGMMPEKLEDLRIGLWLLEKDDAQLDELLSFEMTSKGRVVEVEGSTALLPVFRILLDMDDIDFGGGLE